MVAFLYRMGVGIPGDVNRLWVGTTIEPNYVDPTKPIAAYGNPVKLNATGTGVAPMTVGDVAANVYGVLARPFPKQQAASAGNFGQQLFTDPTPPPSIGDVLDILRRGYMTITVNANARAGIQKGTPVFIWIAATAAGHVQGYFDVAGGSNIAAPATYMGPCDANGNNEIAWNI